MEYLIIANGVLRPGDWVEDVFDQSQIVVAVNGGYKHLLKLARQPDLLVGDLDSLSGTEIGALNPERTEVIRHPARKDANDLELALRLAAERGASKVTLLGLLGGRWDQSLANLLLLADPGFKGTELQVIDGPQRAYVARPDNGVELKGSPGDLVSLIPVRGDAVGVRTSGLEYGLDGETLDYGSSRGVSNVMTAASAKVTLEEGALLCLQIRGGESAL